MPKKPSWSEDAVKEMLHLLRKGLSFSMIAEQFGVSRNSVIGLWYRLRNGGVYPHLADAVAEVAEHIQRRAPQRAVGKKRKRQIVESRRAPQQTVEKRREPQPEKRNKAPVEAYVPPETIKYPPFNKPLEYTGDPRQEPPERKQCAFIENDEHSWWYCKRVVRAGSSYCSAHHGVVYVSPKRSARKAKNHQSAQGV